MLAAAKTIHLDYGINPTAPLLALGVILLAVAAVIFVIKKFPDVNKVGITVVAGLVIFASFGIGLSQLSLQLNKSQTQQITQVKDWLHDDYHIDADGGQVLTLMANINSTNARAFPVKVQQDGKTVEVVMRSIPGQKHTYGLYRYDASATPATPNK
jgi:hypothetical protein